MERWIIRFRAKGTDGRWRMAASYNDIKEAGRVFEQFKESDSWADYELVKAVTEETVIAR